MGSLNLQSLSNAITRLDEGWQRYQQDISDTRIRDGLIQRFEFTYEISHKTLKRYLEYASANPAEFDQMTFQDLIRTANEQGLLLGDWPIGNSIAICAAAPAILTTKPPPWLWCRESKNFWPKPYLC